MPVMTYLEAISLAMREEMRADPSVFLIGEDIGAYGGAFKVTKGLLEEFGAKRVIDTPIAESMIAGVCIGACHRGMRPVAEMQFADFITCAFNQIVTYASMNYYRVGVPLPMTVRLPYGGGLTAGPFHSKCPEAWFYHVPGLKLVAPSTPRDARALLKAAIRDPNPVLFFEHKYLYRRAKEEVPERDEEVPLGKGIVRREGRHVTVITYGAMVPASLEAAEAAARDGIETEVVDLRTLLPFDRPLLVESAKKTGKVLIVHEATKTGGIGGDWAAVIAEEAFEHLDAPVRRLAALDTPVPFAPTLEKHYLPDAKKIEKAVRDLAAY